MDEDEKKVPTFSRAPYSSQVFTPYAKKKFNHLPDHIRMFTSKILEHGNLPLAAEQAGFTEKYSSVDFSAQEKQPLKEAMLDCGMTPVMLMSHLRECLEAPTYKTDKHGNPIKDLRLKLKTLELIFRLRGDFLEDKVAASDTENILEMFSDGPKKKTVRDSKKGKG